MYRVQTVIIIKYKRAPVYSFGSIDSYKFVLKKSATEEEVVDSGAKGTPKETLDNNTLKDLLHISDRTIKPVV